MTTPPTGNPPDGPLMVADRYIIATALLNNLPVATADHRFAEYGLETFS